MTPLNMKHCNPSELAFEICQFTKIAKTGLNVCYLTETSVGVIKTGYYFRSKFF